MSPETARVRVNCIMQIRVVSGGKPCGERAKGSIKIHGRRAPPSATPRGEGSSRAYKRNDRFLPTAFFGELQPGSPHWEFPSVEPGELRVEAAHRRREGPFMHGW